jgi:ABC transporter substrate binding protein
LRDLGYEAGRNIVIEYRWAEGEYERFAALIAELIALNVDVIVTAGTPASLAVKKATSSIPPRHGGRRRRWPRSPCLDGSPIDYGVSRGRCTYFGHVDRLRTVVGGPCAEQSNFDRDRHRVRAAVTDAQC